MINKEVGDSYDTCGHIMSTQWAKLPLRVTALLAIVSQLTVSSAYLRIACVGGSETAQLACSENEIIRVARTVITYQESIPGQEMTCEEVDFVNNCHAYTNVSDYQFVGKQTFSYPIQPEDLATHPEREGDCQNAVRSNWAKVYYECVSTGSSRLQDICGDVLWENEFDGYLTSPYFPKDYPVDSDTELECQCELRPDDRSRIDLTALLINPSSSGITWSLQMDTGTGYDQDLAGQFLASRIIQTQYNTGVITLKFRSLGTGVQQPTRAASPAGFWIQYQAVLKTSALPTTPNPNTPYPSNPNQNTPPNSRNQYTSNPNSRYYGRNYGPMYKSPGRVTVYCNDPYGYLTAGGIAGIVIGSIVLIALVVFIVWFVRRRKRKNEGKSYRADEPHVYSGKTNKVVVQETNNGEPVEQGMDGSKSVYNPYHTPRRHMGSEEYSEMPQPGRGGRHRTYSNNSYNDKVFLDEVDKKSLQSSGRTGDNDSIAKKSLSTDSQADNYSDVNYSPKGIRMSTSLGKDTAV